MVFIFGETAVAVMRSQVRVISLFLLENEARLSSRIELLNRSDYYLLAIHFADFDLWQDPRVKVGVALGCQV